MEAFEAMQQYFSNVGIDLYQLSQKHPLNAKNLRAFFILGSCIALNWMYTLHVASNFLEYTNSIQNGSQYVIVCLMFMVFVSKTKHLFQFVNSFDFIIQNRK